MAHRTPLALTALLATSGALHLARPQTFDGIVPEALPGRSRTWTYLSGAAELGCAAALAAPRTRRLGGTLAALLFVAVFPANVKMARDALGGSGTSPARRAITVGRLPLQIPLVVAALRARRA
jgi:uncharacterized membrane protein